MGVQELALFGSVLRRTLPESDVDVLVTFDGGRGVLGRHSHARELEQMLGRKVDLSRRTPSTPSPPRFSALSGGPCSLRSGMRFS